MESKIVEIWKKIHLKKTSTSAAFVSKIAFHISKIGLEDFYLGGHLLRVYIMDSNLCHIHILSMDEAALDAGDTEKEQTTFNQYTVQCTPTPTVMIEQIILSPSGHSLALYACGGVYVMETTSLPSPSKGNTVKMNRKLQLLYKSTKNDITVIQVKWHPKRDNCLVVMTSDNCLRLFNTHEPKQDFVRVIQHASPSKVSRALRETAVDFDFGTSPDPSSLCPVYVLLGTGQVLYCPDLYSADSGDFEVLAMVPASDDNYGEDFAKILCLRKRPNLLVLASSTGQLYHCLVVFSGDLHAPSLVTVDCVELDLKPFVTANTSLEELETCIHLEQDPYSTSRYHCIHNLGVHSVELKWLSNLRLYYGGDESSQWELSDFTVDNVLCTRTLPSAPASTIVGFTIVQEGEKSRMICCTQSGQLINIVLHSELPKPLPAPVTKNGHIEARTSKKESGEPEDTFMNHMQQILRHDRTIPFMKAADDAEISEKDCVSFLVQTSEAIRGEYKPRLEKARSENVRRRNLLEQQQEFLKEETRNITEEIQEMTNNAEKLAQRSKAVIARDESIELRLSAVVKKLRGRENALSRAETAMKEDVERIHQRVRSNLMVWLERSEARLHSYTEIADQRVHKGPTTPGNKRRDADLTPDRVDRVSIVLRDEGQQIQLLMKFIKMMSLNVRNEGNSSLSVL